MTILALEFSSAQRSVAVTRGGGVAEIIETGGRGTNAFSLIERALAEAGLKRGEIEVIVVGLGPGSYAGIRVALSIAQGWQVARGVKLLGISSVECLAAQAQWERMFGRVNVGIDAQRNEFYHAAYDISPARLTETKPLQIMAGTTIRPGTAGEEIWIGPEVTRWHPQGKILFPSAAALNRLAQSRDDFTTGDQLTPIYIRETNFVKAPQANPILY